VTNIDLMKLLEEKIAVNSQAAVARALGISSSALSQLMGGTYKAAPDAILERVREIYGGISVDCPVLGEIPLHKCATERKQPFAATSHQRVALFKACQSCERSKP
jgi:DNA-binding transcriptional regulator YdaS (Cro superfamily)